VPSGVSPAEIVEQYVQDVGLGAGAGARRSSSGGTSQQQQASDSHPPEAGWGCQTEPLGAAAAAVLKQRRERCGGSLKVAGDYAGASDAPGCGTETLDSPTRQRSRLGS